MINETDEPFIFSSALRNRQRFFDGYCFKGRDYIWGHGGAEQYEKETGIWPLGSEDGCYASIQRNDDDFLVSPDFWGYKKIYFFHSSDFWAFSNSLMTILDHLSAHGISLPPNEPVLQSIVMPGVVFQQVFSYDLIARRLQLLPSGCELRIGKSGVRVSRFSREEPVLDYQSALSVALETWVCRIETLLTSGNVQLVADLTGGLDSRTVFSLVHRARVRAGLDKSAFMLNCGSIKGDTTDLQVAKDICDRMKLSLNLPREQNASIISGNRAVNNYEKRRLGVYHPLYLAGRSMHPLDVYFGGGGGENYRPFYRVRNAKWQLKFWKSRDQWKLFVASCVQKSPNAFLAKDLESMLHAGMRRLKGDLGDQRDSLMLHYQHFRNRFHAGFPMENKVHFCPLASFLFDDLARCAGQNRLQVGQIHYDVIYSLVPNLLGVPFDERSKNPSSEVLKNLTLADVGREANPGRMFIEDFSQSCATSSGISRFEVLAEKLNFALKSDLPYEVLGARVVADARSAVETAIASGRFFHASDGISISAVLAAGLFR